MGKISSNPDFDSSGVDLKTFKESPVGKQEFKGDLNDKETEEDEETEEIEENKEPEKEEKQSEGKSEEESEEETTEEKKFEETEEETETLDISEDDAREYAQWKKDHPGFNLKSLMADYTKKSQTLADINRRSVEEKKTEKEKTEPIQASEGDGTLSKTVKDLADEFGWSEEQVQDFVKLSQKILPAMGYVPKDVLLKTQNETSVQTAVDNFVEKHPEFNKDNDPNDEKWNLLLGEFNLFDRSLRNNPKLTAKLLEKARENVFGRKGNDENKTLVQIRKNAIAKRGSGGGGGQTKTVERDEKVNVAIERLRASGWSEADIKEYFD